ncbi:MAG: hypothetical protein HKL90_08205 [Elusimicrobia bacterium]|nr:hypothetical protein [Elusimicrobiota bacterium]
MRLVKHLRRTSIPRSAAAVAVGASLALGDVPAYAQRRQAEPDANPAFQSQTSGTSSDAGGPVAEPGAAAAASPAAAAPGGADAALGEPRSVQSVQIGAAAPPVDTEPAETAPLDTRVTVRVKGVPLATFLDTISAQAKINFIITEGLEEKRVTAFLQNVTVRDALQVLLEIKGLTYQRIGKTNTYVVTQRSKQAENLVTRIYALSYIPLIDLTAKDVTSVAATTTGSAGAASVAPPPQAPAPASSGGGGGGGGGGGNKPCSPKNRNIDIARILCSVLSKSGDIEIEPRTNSIIVTDIPESFPQVEQILSELDKKAPQVLIETQIVEIDSTRTRNLGFEWGGQNGELGTFTGGKRDTTFPMNMSSNPSNTHFFDPLLLPGGVISTIGMLAGGASGAAMATPMTQNTQLFGSYLQTSVLDLTSLAVTLRALVESSEARFLGKPKVLTLNNKTATIEIQQNQAVAIQSTLAGGFGVTQSVQQAERYDTGVKLQVTPQVNKDGYITMLLEPTFANVEQSVVSTAANPVFDPLTRASVTLVRVKNGQTVVIGGLLESNETKDVRKVPFLGYIPLIGWLFTSNLYTRTNTDLVIFITPTIVSD